MNQVNKIRDPQAVAAAELPRSPRQGGTNLFDLLRLIAAGAVLLGHACWLTGANVHPTWFGNDVGPLGVKVFFVISGLLVTRSWMADPRPAAFAMRRALRIMPGLTAVVLVSAFILGPMVTTLPLKDYFSSPGVPSYLRNILLFPVYALPGVFGDNPFPTAVNGSLWSLPAEVLMYILTPLIIGRAPEKAKVAVAAVALISAVCGLYLDRVTTMHPTPVFYGTSLASVLDAMPYFQIGSVVAVFRLDRFARPAFSTLLLVVSALVLGRVGSTANVGVISEIVLMIVLPYAVVSLGTVEVSGRLAKVLSSGDVSYGLYLYGFPIEQMISWAFRGHIGWEMNFVLAVPFTFACAAASWQLVEQPLLRLKPRKPAQPLSVAQGGGRPAAHSA